MSQNHDFRFKSSAPSTPSAGIATYYTNNSGILRFVHPNGTDYVASTFYPTTGAKSVVATGLGVFNNVTTSASGLLYGTTGTYLYPTVLGEPNFWINAIGPNGQLLSIPAYTRSA